MNHLDSIKRNVVDFIGEEEAEKRLRGDRPLKVKLGVDPTRPDLTFGHLVVLNKLRQFQDLGHETVFIIGDFTTRIGDPSGQSATRPVLTVDEIEKNSNTYFEQAFRILLPEKTTVRRNSEWFESMSFSDALALARKMTVARMLERDDFSARYAAQTPISIVEFLYPLVQGHDSLVIDADIEVGGTDQLFNMLVGRTVQRIAGKVEQMVITLPLLVGLDGVKKMSKSLNNYIAFNDPPKDMFGKIMSINDEVMWDYYRLLLLKTPSEIAALKTMHPKEAKLDLAEQLTERFAGREAAGYERLQFEKVFSNRDLRDDIPAFSWADLGDEADEHARLIDLLGSSNLFASRKEARRLTEQGAVRIDGERCTNPHHMVSRPEKECVIQAGKRTFFKVVR